MLNMINEYTWQRLAIRPKGRLNSRNVIETLADTAVQHST